MPLTVKIGCDPELFVRNKTTGEFVSAHDLLPGTKDKPHPVDLGAVQVDGVAAEFNINPSLTANEFLTNIQAVTGKLQSMVGDGFELVSQPTWEIPEKYFKTLPDNVRELGCNPDFNAWTGQVNDRPDGDTTFLRTAAGHIHIGWGEKMDPSSSIHFEDCRVIAKQLDYYLGMYSLMWDEDTKRRTLYGKAGSFRPKPYGMEYRPLSNVWLRTKRLQNWVWNAAYRGVVDLINNGTRLEDRYNDAAKECIDGNIKWWKEKGKVSDISSWTNLETPPPLPKENETDKSNEPRFGEIVKDRWYTGFKTSRDFNYNFNKHPEIKKALEDGKIMFDHSREEYYIPASYFKI
jgi:hypothetical protein